LAISTAVLIVLVVASVAALGVVLVWRAALDVPLPVVDEEEPLLPDPVLPVARAAVPIISFSDLEPGAGATSITFNLGVLLATEGQSRDPARRPRPICLLAEGELTAQLGVSPDDLLRYLDDHPVGLDDQ